MRFLAIDFETANSKRSSICAFGFALFEDGHLIESGSELCRPVPDFFDPWNIRIHAITPEMTIGLSGFEAHINKIKDYNPDFVVAHNASFDISCIRNWCDVASHSYPQFEYLCTLVSSRLLFPSAPSHTLDSICQMHHISLNHHEAESDAVACGFIMQKAAEIIGAKSHTDFCKKLKMRSGNVYDNGYTPCVARS
jgi:DNA polymerase-3 subunit epsilon